MSKWKCLILLLLGSAMAFSQDLIVLKDSTKVPCKITGEDSLSVYYTSKDAAKPGDFKVNRNDMARYQKNFYKEQAAPAQQTQTASTPGSAAPQKKLTTSTPEFQYDKTILGIGMGMDNGGLFGLNLLLYPLRDVGIFGGVGYAMAGFGYNAGIKLRWGGREFKRVTPFGLAMYGYNAAIVVSNAQEYSKLFYGPSFGVGFDIRRSQYAERYWSFALLIPVRGPEVDQYMSDLQTKHHVQFNSGLSPIGVSFTWRFILN